MLIIHYEPAIPWHGPFAEKMFRGLRNLDFDVDMTSSRRPLGGDCTPILLGTSLWRQIEAAGEYLLVDRCSFGDTSQYVSLVWNGHGRRGDHRVPDDYDASRWERHGVEVHPWRRWSPRRGKVVLCGQAESYCERDLHEWYADMMAQPRHRRPTHFRPHPAAQDATGLPTWQYWDGVERVITLNSSVAVEAILRGIPTEVHDAGGVAYPGFSRGDDRMPWLHWLAWTQWHHDEIAAGEPIGHLFHG